MTDTITPEKLRKLAATPFLPVGSVLTRMKWLRERQKALSEAADEIERLQSDVTELMSACNGALNEKRTAALDELGALDGETLP